MKTKSVLNRKFFHKTKMPLMLPPPPPETRKTDFNIFIITNNKYLT
jgi:hypothetical protein